MYYEHDSRINLGNRYKDICRGTYVYMCVRVGGGGGMGMCVCVYMYITIYIS